MAQTLTHRHGEEVFVDTLGAYFLGKGEERPRLEDLLALADLLGAEDMARGPTRTLLTLMGQSLGEAKNRYRRWLRVLGERDKENKSRRTEAFETLLSRLLEAQERHDPLPYAKDEKTEVWRTPLGDALALLGAGHVTGKGKESTDMEAA
ncbi:MAG TPA: hypothetical protein ENJ38_12195 [Rhodospirillales bacterium]|nr:hypothetical protein [Rhodospirillales bacterium]